MCDAATPGFDSDSRAKSLVSTEPVELFCRASDVSSTVPFCFIIIIILSASSNKNRKRLIFSCSFYLQICAAPPSVRRTKIHGDKGCLAVLTTIKQGNQHSGPNRNSKHNQAETTIHFSFCHVHVLTKNDENTLLRVHYTQKY